MNNITNGSYASSVSGYAYAGYKPDTQNKTNTAGKDKTSSAKGSINHAGGSNYNADAVYNGNGDKKVTSYNKNDNKTDTVYGKGKKLEVSGQTIGNPKLSEKASKYYDELKKKYSNMNFILVSEDMKEQAKANASSYANASKMVVLIDEDKIERMAEDENYRKQYEAIIANAASGLSQLGNSIAATGASVKGYGMQVNDNGTATYFAVLEKSSAAQKDRIEKKAAKKKAEQKAKDKKAQKEAEAERIKKNKDKSKEIKDTDDDDADSKDVSDTITITASSIEELLSKLQKESQNYLSDNIYSEAEKKIGQGFDYSL